MVGDNTNFRIAVTNKNAYTFTFKNKKYGTMIWKEDYPTREECGAVMNEFIMKLYGVGQPI
jgi:hypothetical protein